MKIKGSKLKKTTPKARMMKHPMYKLLDSMLPLWVLKALRLSVRCDECKKLIHGNNAVYSFGKLDICPECYNPTKEYDDSVCTTEVRIKIK